MVLLRSMPEFSTMCFNAMDFLGDAMSCTSKDSAFVHTINCNTMHCIDSSAWCTTDSRDDEQKVTESSSLSSKPSLEMDLSSNSNDNSDSNNNSNNNESSSTSRKGVYDELSSSVHQLLHDSSERTNLSQGHRTDSSTTLLSVPEGDSTIFRPHETNETNERTTMEKIEKTRSSQDEEEEEESKSDTHTDTDTHTQGVQFSKLQRCTAWSQADDHNCHIYSFEDDNSCLLLLSPDTTTHDESQVNIVHWDDIVHGAIECQETPIFRPTTPEVGPHFSLGSSGTLDRCAAWSVDESSNSIASLRGSVRLGAIQEETVTTKIHWDAIVKDSIYA